MFSMKFLLENLFQTDRREEYPAILRHSLCKLDKFLKYGYNI